MIENLDENIRDLTNEEIEALEQLAKTNLVQPINPELTYTIKGSTLINMLVKIGELHQEVTELRRKLNA